MLNGDIKVLERDHFPFDVDIYRWRHKMKPHGISGLFRVKNEEEFLRASVISHIHYLDEVVIILQPSEDKTKEVAEKLALDYPLKIKIKEYPFSLHPVGSKEHMEAAGNSVFTMSHMTNWGLSQCAFSFIAKIEGDVLEMGGNFGKIRELVDRFPNRTAYYGRVGINVAGEKATMFAANAPRNAGWDEAVFNNDPFWHCVTADKWETMNLHEHSDRLYNCGWSFVHTKRCKAKHQRLKETEDWQELTEENLRPALESYNKQRPYPCNDENYIYEWVNTWKL